MNANEIPAVHVRGQETTLKVGLVGCGGRGTGAADNVLDAAENVQITALADMFPDRLQKCRAQVMGKQDAAGRPHPGAKIQEDFCFTGFDAYKKILDSGIDYVMLCQPPGFRPIHFAAAIDAGKHVFFEKPVAVDPVGVRKVIEYGEKAKEKKLGIVPGTQSRHTPRIIETVKRIHDGAIGEVISGRIYFNTGYLWEYPRKDGMSDMEWQIRNWYYFDWLSGDHIVEQHVHQHDVTDWVMRSNPVRATAVGGRQMRTEELYGNIYDHFQVDYEYPNGVHVMSMCRQWKGTPGEVGALFVGTKGTAYVQGKNAGVITGPNAWKYEPVGKEINGQVLEHRDLIASIRAGKPLNEARRIAGTSLTSILGREAAYTGKVVKYDDLMKSDLDLSPKKYEFGPNQARPVQIPGKSA
ncbi:MAG TPA: Gfo/Idh/MocA family oxidoreductase [Planctomycetota bacterium]|nr:Gfo/Idh/MocA family oxidoreductase [Planctomycetota bacterium]